MLDSADTRPKGARALVRELAHELRDALSPLASSADLARLRNFDPEASRQLVEKVQRGLQRALTTLDAFVLAEQCEDRTLQLAVDSVALDKIMQAGRNALGESTGKCRFEPAAAPIMVRADIARSAQALAAVLQQAAALAVRESAVKVRADSTSAHPQIRVRGHVAAENVPSEEWFASYRGGSGRMSLRTARCILALQGGGLDLTTSKEGEFELVLRFAAESGEAEAPSGDSRLAPRAVRQEGGAAAARPGERILIVDDSREVRRAYREALRALGYIVFEAADAEQALSALEDSPPDVALIDIHLPRMNGYRLAQAIRARLGSAIYLVMLSGMALDEVTRGLAREAGFDDCLDKMAGPIALRELLGAVEDRS